MVTSKELSSKQVCQRLKCSDAQLSRFRQADLLHVRHEKPQGHCRVWYSADEVDKLAKRWRPKFIRKPKQDKSGLVMTNVRGPTCAKIFSLLMQNVPFARIVIEADADPLLVLEMEELLRGGDFEERRKRADREKVAADEREKQRIHDARQERDRHRDWRLRLAEREAKAAAARAIEMVLAAQKKDAEAIEKILEEKRSA